jgi:hypothetical protein
MANPNQTPDGEYQGDGGLSASNRVATSLFGQFDVAATSGSRRLYLGRWQDFPAMSCHPQQLCVKQALLSSSPWCYHAAGGVPDVSFRMCITGDGHPPLTQHMLAD